MTIDARELRNAFGSFTTGVTLMTTQLPGQEPVGMTVNSFSSLSLNPPLLLWSIDLESSRKQVFDTAETFAVNVLSVHQKELSSAFAKSSNDQTEAINSLEQGDFGLPIAADSKAVFECKVWKRVDAGDHQIIIGEIQGFRVKPEAPALAFAAGRYHELGDMLPY